MFLVHCQSVTAEESTVTGVLGNSATFQWRVDQNGSSLLSLFIVHGTEFTDISVVLFTLVGNDLSPSPLVTNYFKGRLNATISDDVRSSPKFFCTLTFNDLQLSDRDETFLLRVSFAKVGVKEKVITLGEVRGINCVLYFFISSIFYPESHYFLPFS